MLGFSNPVMVKEQEKEEDIELGEPCCDGLATSLQIPMYFAQSRFHPRYTDQLVFILDIYHPDMNENALFMYCLKELDVMINRKSKFAVVPLQTMQAIFAMQAISPHAVAADGTMEHIPITFLNAQMGPVGVQRRSTREEALIVVHNSCYVKLPHATTYLVSHDGKLTENTKRNRLMIGDFVYLIFRYVPLTEKATYVSMLTSQGPFAWTARPGTVYPDIITTNRTLEGHRLIGLVETVERKSLIRIKLLLSSIGDANVMDIQPF